MSGPGTQAFYDAQVEKSRRRARKSLVHAATVLVGSEYKSFFALIFEHVEGYIDEALFWAKQKPIMESVDMSTSNNLPGYGDEATWGGRTPDEQDEDPRIEEFAQEITDDLFDGKSGYRFGGQIIDRDYIEYEVMADITPRQIFELGDGDALKAFLGVAKMRKCEEIARKIAAERIADMDAEDEMDAALLRRELAEI